MRKKVFIIDGPDGTGKTTLAQRLSETYNIPIYHLTYYKDREQHQKQFYTATEMMRDWISNSEGGFIIDRYILSEIIYRKIYRPDEPLIKEAEFMYEFMEHRAAIGEIEVIIALPENRDKWFQHFSKLCEEREEMYSTEKILEVYEEYLEHWKKLRYNKHVMRYDLFENMEGQNKNKVTDINDAK